MYALLVARSCISKCIHVCDVLILIVHRYMYTHSCGRSTHCNPNAHICMWLPVYTYMYMYVYILIRICLYVVVAPAPHSAIPTRIYVCDYVYIHIYICMFIYLDVYVHMEQLHLLLSLQFWPVYKYVITGMYIYIYVYICSCIHTNIFMCSSCTCSSRCSSNTNSCVWSHACTHMIYMFVYIYLCAYV